VQRQKSELTSDSKKFSKKRLEQLAKWRKDRYVFQR